MFVQQGRSPFGARSVQAVREHDKGATCLREAASAEAGNAAGGHFQHPALCARNGWRSLVTYRSTSMV